MKFQFHTSPDHGNMAYIAVIMLKKENLCDWHLSPTSHRIIIYYLDIQVVCTFASKVKVCWSLSMDAKLFQHGNTSSAIGRRSAPMISLNHIFSFKATFHEILGEVLLANPNAMDMQNNNF